MTCRARLFHFLRTQSQSDGERGLGAEDLEKVTGSG